MKMNECKMSEVCPICHEQLHNGALNGVYTIPECKHKYHTECMMFWFQTQGNRTSCPMCRGPGGIDYDIRHYERKGKARYLRRYSLRKDAPEDLKKLGDKLRDSDKKLKEHQKNMKDFEERHKDIIKNPILKEYSKLKNKKWILQSNIRKAEGNLAGYPLFQIPEKLIQVVKNKN